MKEQILKWSSVYFSSMFKFVGGPLLGSSMDLTLLETWFFTSMGMMTTVLVISYFHAPIYRVFYRYRKRKSRKVFSSRNRMFVSIWRKWGSFGVAFLTPVLFSPIVGTLLMVSLGEKKNRLISYMAFSAFFWGGIISHFIDLLVEFLMQTV
ncbi:MAG: hypothetical protein MI784_01135 [Cytophagales bacterium]|nr:hypothetical protein [Cytophagales bacterium]